MLASSDAGKRSLVIESCEFMAGSFAYFCGQKVRERNIGNESYQASLHNDWIPDQVGDDGTVA